MNGLLTAMRNTVEDLYGHVHRVGRLSVALGEVLGLGETQLRNLATAGVFHDVGKIHIDPAILSKPGPLTGHEVTEIRKHPELGYAMAVDHLDPEVALAILHHHERWDGGGYPHGLTGEEIPRLARVVLVADAFDAITSERSYQPAMPVDYAIAEIVSCSGSQFDPEVVEALLVLASRDFSDVFGSAELF